MNMTAWSLAEPGRAWQSVLAVSFPRTVARRFTAEAPAAPVELTGPSLASDGPTVRGYVKDSSESLKISKSAQTWKACKR